MIELSPFQSFSVGAKLGLTLRRGIRKYNPLLPGSSLIWADSSKPIVGFGHQAGTIFIFYGVSGPEKNRDGLRWLS
jgi:hypothetical protein